MRNELKILLEFIVAIFMMMVLSGVIWGIVLLTLHTIFINPIFIVVSLPIGGGLIFYILSKIIKR
jgi:hypothetical protein